jgi:ribosomal protein S25
MFTEKNELLKEVNKSGAVSPATLAMESKIPVSIPVAAPR